jgi:hypothetical protein
LSDVEGKAARAAASERERVSKQEVLIPQFLLSLDIPIYKIDLMKFTKNIGMLLLAVYLIIDGLLGFGLNLGPAIFLLYVVALASGVFILVGK